VCDDDGRIVSRTAAVPWSVARACEGPVHGSKVVMATTLPPPDGAGERIDDRRQSTRPGSVPAGTMDP
jgi:hypothetical protein